MKNKVLLISVTLLAHCEYPSGTVMWICGENGKEMDIPKHTFFGEDSTHPSSSDNYWIATITLELNKALGKRCIRFGYNRIAEIDSMGEMTIVNRRDRAKVLQHYKNYHNSIIKYYHNNYSLRYPLCYDYTIYI